IRTPLGIAHEYPEEALNRVADFYKASNLIVGAKQRIDGLSLRATDTGWSTGSGPEVAGPHLSLILAMTGRSAALAGLSGAGGDTPRSRPYPWPRLPAARDRPVTPARRCRASSASSRVRRWRSSAGPPGSPTAWPRCPAQAWRRGCPRP